MMKKLLLKTFSAILVFVLTFNSAGLMNASATDDEPDFPCGGVIEEVDVKILYAPPISRVVVGGFGPVITGTVLKVTYPNGESEMLTVKQNGNEYYAGDFSVYMSYFELESIQVVNYGVVSKTIRISNEGNQHGGYSGYADFVYLNLPSVAEVFYLISAYFKMIF